MGRGLKDFALEMNSKCEDLLNLTEDMKSMKHGLKTVKPYSRRTVEPITRLRKSESELKEAKDNPNEQFIKDRLHDILGI